MRKIFVIAGNIQQYNYYIKAKGFDKLYVYVSSPDTLRGHQDVHGVFIGTWRERKDIVDILDTLIIRTSSTDVIKDMYKEIGKPPLLNKPVLKKKQPTYSRHDLIQALIEEASELMHKEIDDAILRDILPS